MLQSPLNRDKTFDKPPLRAELYSTEQLDQHAIRIAKAHELTHEKSEERLLVALSDNEKAIREVLNLLQLSVKEKKEITPAGEWLLDNYYLIEEQIRMAQKYLPKNFSQSLPKLKNGEYAGYPRVYDIAVELLAHSDCYLSIENLSAFLAAYQKVDYLTIGELWALPIMLRLALIENLRRVATGIARDRSEANIAEYWVNKLFKKVKESPRDLVLVIADMAKSNPPLNSAFVAEFTRRVQWKGPSLNLALNWIEQSLSEYGESINSMVIAENQKKAAYQVSMSNSITSLRLLSKIDWREFVETLSVIEQILRTDNHGTYGNMDFETRNRYRHVVEDIARNSPLSEKEVAELAISLTRRSHGDIADYHSKKSHVGYFLLSDGLEQLKKIAGYRLPVFSRFSSWLRKRSGELYFIAAGFITFSIAIGFIAKSVEDFESLWWFTWILVCSVLTASYFAFSIVNWWMSLWILPKALPRMDFSEHIPDDCRTLVAVPTLLANREQIKELLYDLEIRYLANRDENLFFALVTDFRDADQEIKPEDDELLEFAASGILELNNRYHHPNNEKFFLFHRPRKWNPAEGVWMGYERKRGKLGDLNRLLRGNKESFSLIVGDERIYTSIKYIITLDSDTQLPREAAWKMVGLMAHPLNKPIIDEKDKRVIEGYGIIQPRLSISLSGAKRTYFSRMFENDSGIDPYTRVVSDLYQDVFQEGSFIGKGIYDLDVFEDVIDDRFPENRILSHDLLEGSYLRCAYASDVQVFEEFPSSYENDIARRHRWIRGDWQIGLWALPFIIDSKFRIRRNPINLLAKWKILDNLRRSLIPFAFTALLVTGWIILKDAWFWNTFLTALLITPPILFSLWEVFKKPEEITWNKHLYNSFRNTVKNVLHALFFILCLPYEAYISLHAIIITLWRLLVTQKKLLEWNPFGLASFKSTTIAKAYEKMWVAPMFSVAITIYLFISKSWITLLMATPYLIAWMAFPGIIWLLNRPVAKPKIKELDNQQKRNLRVLARETWAYFESLVGNETNWLPPDNLQIQPKTIVADRTSPTNIGLMLLANLSAYDFGYLTLSAFVERTRLSLQTMGKMERFYGHFYNWYNIHTLQPLHPRYISSVDSGNLGGHLLTLRQGIIELQNAAIQPNRYAEGILDTLRVLLKLLPISKQENKDFFNLAKRELLSEGNIPQFYQTLSKVRNLYEQLIQPLHLQENSDLLIWHEKFIQNVEQIQSEINTLLPWICDDSLTAEAQQLLTPISEMTLRQWASMNIRDLLKGSPAPEKLQSYLEKCKSEAKVLTEILGVMTEQCADFADMDYDFLYDRSQRLLAIGYNAEEHKRDVSYYDLLASEARLTIFIAIAQGKIPQESWFALGRRLTTVGNTPTLISWSGSMFEYLMPMLVMPTYNNTLLDETMQGCVKKQIEYGNSRNIPWGISESCYNVLDSNLVYQYKAFGVPGLGFKRGLGQDLVVAPYASVMALMVDPVEAYKNIERMKTAGYEGVYGFYEAVDFTPARLPKDKKEELIHTFMVHHEGMSLLSLANVLLEQPMQKRFEKDPELQTAMLLLQERIPRVSGFYQGSSEVEINKPSEATAESNIYHTPDTSAPAVQILSNGNLHTMITNAGGGYTHWNGIALNRWREDGTQDNYGSFIYIRNLDTGEFWSNTFQPTLKKPQYYAADFSYGKAEFHRVDNQIETHTEIIISPEDDVEIRRIRLNNQGRNSILLEITSYSEVVLANEVSDMHHSAFSNLFVQTEIIPHQQTIICSRRARSKGETPPWMFHCMRISNAITRKISFETSRLEFIGRGRSLANPAVMDSKGDLSGTQGYVLDPVVAIRKVVRIEPFKTIVVDIINGISYSREGILKQIVRYQDIHIRNRAFELSWTHNQVILHQINSNIEEAQMFGRLASSILFANKEMRASEHLLAQNSHGQSSLWSYSISGDLPIILLKVSHISNIELVRQLIQAVTFWDMKGLKVDLVILNEDSTSYRQELQNEIQGMIAARFGQIDSYKKGRIFLRPADQVPAEDQILFQSVARVVLSDKLGNLEEQLSRQPLKDVQIPDFKPTSFQEYPKEYLPLPEGIIFYNTYGGFSSDGNEYIINCHKHKCTPLPWVNIIANKQMATLVSECGSGYTWYENAYGYRLTPWSNDPVNDPATEACYLRDEETGQFWSLTPRPANGSTNYICHHGFGYTMFEHLENEIFTELSIFVDSEEAIKFTTIKIINRSKIQRKLSLSAYIEWVLASFRSQSMMHVVTEVDPETGAFIARNSYNTEFPGRMAFLDTDAEISSYTCDRKEFIGRNRNLGSPKAMTKEKLSNKSGAGLDPCTAIQTHITLEAGEEYQTVFRLGAAKNRESAIELIIRTRGLQYAQNARKRVERNWENTLHTIKIQTPDTALNLLANGWLLYQTLSSRIWGRSGFYQSGGAYGFRDQLQDVMSLLYSNPGIARKHILLSASRQFVEGDVQHWWHPPAGRGVRTLCSDDYLWLPYVTAKYIYVTGDIGILNEQENYLEGRLLNEGEESYYDMPVISNKKSTLYEHCKLAIRHGFRLGQHGLPLIGSGDWNDGMNLVGIEGKGESIWLAFFLYDVLQQFILIAEKLQDSAFAEECSLFAEKIRENVNLNGWDGLWYRRAFFDDGTPLGSSENEECSIDSISQSWSLLSGAGELKKCASGLKHAYKYLVDKEKGLIKLLHPAFNHSQLEPGYIKGYVPGVRENGGQYTHAAIWMVMAFAKSGDRKKVWELLKMINPVNHGITPQHVSIYKVEPYVVAADVYGVEPHTGRGGWTWYTGSASWMYQLILEHFLGIRKHGCQLMFNPVVPEEWNSFKVDYLFESTHYLLQFEASSAVTSATVIQNGQRVENNILELTNDGKIHEVQILYPK